MFFCRGTGSSLACGRSSTERIQGDRSFIRHRQHRGAMIFAVRTSPLIGEKAWFGPRRIGWGLGPVSPEGWVLTALFSGISLLAKQKRVGRELRWLLFGLMATVIVLKGTSPGGPAARVAFDHERAPATTTSGPDQASDVSGSAQASAVFGPGGEASSAE
jgi:hypothetical protein